MSNKLNENNAVLSRIFHSQKMEILAVKANHVYLFLYYSHLFYIIVFLCMQANGNLIVDGKSTDDNFLFNILSDLKTVVEELCPVQS